MPGRAESGGNSSNTLKLLGGMKVHLVLYDQGTARLRSMRRRVAWENHMRSIWGALLGLFVFVGCQPTTQDTRADTRAAVSGRVVLADTPGLSDMSRVRVEIGKGEGGSTPEEDGMFQMTDLEPDVYEVRVLYIGGLTSDATESAYQEFTRRVLLQEGGNVDLGDIKLEVGLGVVTGGLVLTDESSTDGAIARLTNDTLMREAPVVDGVYTFADVPIGTYNLQVEKEGYTLAQEGSMSGSSVDDEEGGESNDAEGTEMGDLGCTQNTVVGFHSENVAAADFRFTPTNVSLLPGMGEIQTTRGSQWILSTETETLTANVVGGFITHARMWTENATPGAWEPFASGAGFEIAVSDLIEGNNAIYFQFAGCRYESPVTTLNVLLDKTAPSVESFEVRGRTPADDGGYWIATDAATLTVDFLADDAHSSIAGIAVVHTQDNEAPALADLVFDDVSAGDGLMMGSRQVGLTGGDGEKKIFLFLKDLAGNITESAYGDLSVHVDTEAPVPGSLLITGKDAAGEASTDVTATQEVTLTLSAEGASHYRVGYDETFGGQAWNDFDVSSRSWMLMPGDGTKTVYVQYKDAVGNVTLPISASIVLDTQPPSSTFISLNDGDDFTNSTAATATLSATDATHMRLSVDGLFDEEPWVAYDISHEVTLLSEEGEQRVDVMFRDAAGNVSMVKSDVIYLDMTPPELRSMDLLSIAAASDGTLWVTEENATLAVDIMADDGASGVSAVALVEGMTEPNANDVTFNAVFASPGLFLKTEYVTLNTAEGPTNVYLFLRDAAGNTSAMAGSFALQVDAQAPVFGDPAITVTNKSGTQIYADQAELQIQIADEEDPVMMRVGLQPLTSATQKIPYQSEVAVGLPSQTGLPVAFEVEVFDAAGNMTSATKSGFEVNRSGWLRGNISLEARQPAHVTMDTVLKLFDAGADLATTPRDIEYVTPSGEFEFAEVPEGAGMTLVVERMGYKTQTLAVPTIQSGLTSTLGDVEMEVARGYLSGRIMLEDLMDSEEEGHSGIRVMAQLVSSATSMTVMEAYTQNDGTFDFPYPGLPVNVEGESYTILAQLTGYFAESFEGQNVVEGDVTEMEPSRGELRPVSGDFDLCDPSTFGDGDCQPAAYTNLDAVGVRLRVREGVTQIRAMVGDTPFDPEAAEPAWEDYPTNAVPQVDIQSVAEGMIKVFVQVKDAAGNAGLVMNSQILVDRTAPQMRALTLNKSEDALRSDVTKEKAVNVTAEAELETADYAAPLARFEMAFSDESAPDDASPFDGSVRNCPINSACEVSLPRSIGDSVEEKRHVLNARVCDKAGNCSAEFETAAVLYDNTPPWIQSGTYVLNPEDAQMHDGVHYARTNLYSILLNTGTSINTAEAEMMDPAYESDDIDAVALADIYGWRLGFESNLIGEEWQTFDSTPQADYQVSVRGLGLPFGSTEEEVFMQFRDAAGNVTSVPSDYAFTVALDTEAPAASFVLNEGAKYIVQPPPNPLVSLIPITSVDLGFTTTSNDISEVQVSLTGLFDDTQTFPFSASGISVDLAHNVMVEDGEHHVYVRLEDWAGNITERSDSIILDRAPPDMGAVSVDDGSGYMLNYNAQVTVNCYDALANDGELLLDVSVDGEGGPAPEGTGYNGRYGNLIELSVGETQEVKTLNVTCTDPAGNNSEVVSIQATLDSEAPTFAAAPELHHGLNETNNPLVSVKVQVSDGVSGLDMLAFSEADSCDNVAFVEPPPVPSFCANDSSEECTSDSDCCTDDDGADCFCNVMDFRYLLSPNDGLKQVYVCARDMAGNVSTPRETNTVLLDTNPPTNPALSLTGGEWQTSSLTTANLSAVGASHMLIEGDVEEGPNTFDWIDYATSVPNLELSAGDGLKIVRAKFKDEAGNITDAVSAQTSVDETPPVVNSASCSSCQTVEGQLYAPERTIAFDVLGSDEGGSGVEWVKISLADGSAEATISYGNVLEYTLPNSGTSFDLVVWLVDYAGNTSDGSDDAYKQEFNIQLDDAPPVIHSFLVTSAASGYVTDPQLEIKLEVSDDTAFYRISNTGAFTGEPVVFVNENDTNGYPYVSLLHTVQAPTEDESKTVYVEVGDNAGNTAQQSVSVILDTTIPVGTIELAGGADYATVNRVDVVLTYPADATHYAVQNGLMDCTTQDLSSFNSVATSPQSLEDHHLGYGDGTKTVSVCYVDAAGNVAGASDNIILDTQGPTVSMVIENDAAYTQTRTVNLNLTKDEEIDKIVILNEGPGCDSLDFDNDGVGYEDTKGHTLSEGDGTKEVLVCFRDLSGQVTGATDTIELDSLDPNSTLTINDDVPYTNQRSVALTMGPNTPGAADFTDIVSMAVDAADCDTATYTPFVTSLTWLLGETEGDHTLEVCLKDASGRTAKTPAATVHLDTISPVPTVLIENDDAYTTFKKATVSFTFPDDATHYHAAGGAVNCENVSITDQVPADVSSVTLSNFDLPNAENEGEKMVTVCLKDNSGLIGSSFDTIYFDNNAPTVSVTINNGDTYSRSTSVDLTLSASENIAAIAIGDKMLDCNSESTDYSVYDYDVSIPNYDLGSAQGERQVKVCFRDDAGNLSSDVGLIIVDTLNPAATLKIGDDADYATQRQVSLSLLAVEGETNKFDDIKSMAVANAVSLDCDTAVYLPFTATQEHLLSDGDGEKQVVICLKDHAGNFASIGPAVIELDTQIPNGAIELAGGIEFLGHESSGAPRIEVTLTFPDDTLKYRVQNGYMDCTASTMVDLPDNHGGTYTVENHSLSSGEGEKLVTACFEDAAGLMASASAAIYVDQSPPNGTIVLNSGALVTDDANLSVTMSPPADVTHYAIGEGLDCDGNVSFIAYDGESMTDYLVDPAISGLYTIDVCFKDRAGLTAKTTASIILDVDAPVVNSVTITDADGNAIDYAKGVNVYVQVNITDLPDLTGDSGSDGDPGGGSGTGGGGGGSGGPDTETTLDVPNLEMMISEDAGFANAEWVTFKAFKPFTFSTANGPKNVYVKVRDGAEQESNVASDAEGVILDTESPTITSATFIESSPNALPGRVNPTDLAEDTEFCPGGNASTDPKKRFLSIELETNDNLAGSLTASVGLGSSCGDNYSPLSGNTVTVEVGCEDDGIHWVGICVKDAAGNRYTHPSIMLILDRQAPEQVSNVTAVGGSRQAMIDWQEAADLGDSGIQGYEIRYASFAELDGVGTVSVGDITSYSLTGLQDRATYYFQAAARDAAGNLGEFSAMKSFTTGFAQTVPRSDVTDAIIADPDRRFAQATVFEAMGQLYVFSYPTYEANPILKVKTCAYRTDNCRDPQQWTEFDLILGDIDRETTCVADDECGGGRCHEGFCYQNVWSFGAENVRALATSYRIYIAAMTNKGPALFTCDRGCTAAATQSADGLGFSLTYLERNNEDGCRIDQGGASWRSIDIAETTAGIHVAYNATEGDICVASCGKAYEAVPNTGMDVGPGCQLNQNWFHVNVSDVDSKPAFDLADRGPLDLEAWDDRIVLAYESENEGIEVISCYTGSGCINSGNSTGWDRFDANATSMTFAPLNPAGIEYNSPRIILTQDYIYTLWRKIGSYSTTKINRCARDAWIADNDACYPADNEDGTQGSFTQLWGQIEGGEMLSLFKGAGALHQVWWNKSQSRVKYAVCENPNATDCSDGDNWDRVVLANEVPSRTIPHVVQYGQNVLASWIDANAHVHLALPMVPAPDGFVVWPSAQSLRASWNPVSYVDGYDLWYQNARAYGASLDTNLWEQRIPLNDAFVNEVSMSLDTGASDELMTYNTCIRAYGNSGEESSDGDMYQVTAFVEETLSSDIPGNFSSRTCAADNTCSNYGADGWGSNVGYAYTINNDGVYVALQGRPEVRLALPNDATAGILDVLLTPQSSTRLGDYDNGYFFVVTGINHRNAIPETIVMNVCQFNLGQGRDCSFSDAWHSYEVVDNDTSNLGNANDGKTTAQLVHDGADRVFLAYRMSDRDQATANKVAFVSCFLTTYANGETTGCTEESQWLDYTFGGPHWKGMKTIPGRFSIAAGQTQITNQSGAVEDKGVVFLSYHRQDTNHAGATIYHVDVHGATYDAADDNASVFYAHDQATLLNDYGNDVHDYLIKTDVSSDMSVVLLATGRQTSDLLAMELFICSESPVYCTQGDFGGAPGNNVLDHWGRVKLGALDTTGSVGMDLRVTDDGQIYVGYTHRNQVRMAHCAENCTDIAQWRDGVLHIDPVVSPAMYNNGVFWLTEEPSLSEGIPAKIGFVLGRSAAFDDETRKLKAFTGGEWLPLKVY